MNSLQRCQAIPPVLLFLFSLALFLGSPVLNAQVRLHEPAEILKLIEESSISYGINMSDETEAVTHTPEQLPPGFFLKGEGEDAEFGSYKLSEEGAGFLQEAETLFAEKDYEKAITRYRKVLELEPEYSGALTMIGDAYFNMEQFDSARHYLHKAIEMNFIDYQAHWFLSSVEFKLGNKKEGLHELTIAHVLNPGHEALETALKAGRKKYATPWQTWSFAPRYELIDESLETVQVRCGPGWMMYALTQAVWEYEEDYAQNMGVDDPEGIPAEALREKEATLMFIFEYLVRQEQGDKEEEEELPNTEEADAVGKRLAEIVEQGMIDPFIYYEVLGRKNPLLFSVMSRESVENIVAYVEKYH